MKKKQSNSVLYIFIISVIILLLILFIASSSNSNSSNSNSSNNKEVRCWYCSKVIINTDGRVIHATHSFGNTYKCEYCGKDNVVK